MADSMRACVCCGKTDKLIEENAKRLDAKKGRKRLRPLRKFDRLDSMFYVSGPAVRDYWLCHACFNKFRRCGQLCTQGHARCRDNVEGPCATRLLHVLKQLPKGSFTTVPHFAAVNDQLEDCRRARLEYGPSLPPPVARRARTQDGSSSSRRSALAVRATTWVPEVVGVAAVHAM